MAGWNVHDVKLDHTRDGKPYFAIYDTNVELRAGLLAPCAQKNLNTKRISKVTSRVYMGQRENFNARCV